MNKSSAVADMGNHGHNIHEPKRGGGVLCPFRGALGTRRMQCGLRRCLLPYQWRLHPSNRLATINMGQKLGVGGCAFFCGGTGSPSNTKLLGQRPTSIQSGTLVHPAIWPQRTLAYNWGRCPFRGGGAGSPSNTM